MDPLTILNNTPRMHRIQAVIQRTLFITTPTRLPWSFMQSQRNIAVRLIVLALFFKGIAGAQRAASSLGPGLCRIGMGGGK